ncbi:peptide deformylase [Pararhodospirillum photometricum]|nr:peptide deformylase [Pararhodospirillum photometricum]
MALLKIARMGSPVLVNVARLVDDPMAPEIAHLMADMAETLADSGGVGLAAPQVHVPLRVILFHVPAERSGGEAVPLTTLINPSLTVLDDTEAAEWEGCLSLPGLTGRVARPRAIRYQGYDLMGRMVVRDAEGFHARVVQHELDHLNGVLYPMRLNDLADFGFVEEIRRALAPSPEDP